MSNDVRGEKKSRLPFSRPRIAKNVEILCAAFFATFMAYDCLSMLQSTLNRRGGLGVVCQAVVYGCYCVSSLLLPKYVIRKFGCKRTLVASTFFYVPYIASNLYPHWSLMVPAAVLNGLAASLLWGAQCQYLNGMAAMYHHRGASDGNPDRCSPPSSCRREDRRRVAADFESKESPIDPSNCAEANAAGGERRRTRKESEEGDIFHRCCCQPEMVEIDTNAADRDSSAGQQSVPSPNYSRKTASPEGTSSDRCCCEPRKESSTTGAVRDSSLAGKSIVHRPSFPEKASTKALPDYVRSRTMESSSQKTLNVTSLRCYHERGKETGSNALEISSSAGKSSVPPKNSSEKASKDLQSTTARFFGLHGMAYLSTHMWSNLMSYFILASPSGEATSFNSTCLCGAHFCNEAAAAASQCWSTHLQEPSQGARTLLIALCTALAPLSVVLMALFLDPLDDSNGNVQFSLDFLLATCRHLKNKSQIYLTPLSFYIGMMQGFYTGDFNMSYVGCAWGTFHVGLVSTCYGAACSTASSLSGCTVKYAGRPPLLLFSVSLNAACQLLLLLWTPSSEDAALFFVVAGLWGTSVGILWSQVKAFYGFLFRHDEEVAFAAYNLWYSLGFCLSFAYSNHLCTYVKIYALMAVLLLGTICYVCVEISLRRKIKQLEK